MRISALPGALSALFLAGCVTINIYFPAAAVEKAADRIIDEVWQAKATRDGARKDGTGDGAAAGAPAPAAK